MAKLRLCKHCYSPLMPSLSGSICMGGCHKRTVQPKLSAVENMLLQAYVEGRELLEATVVKRRVKALWESKTAELTFMSIYKVEESETLYRRVCSLGSEKEGDVIALLGKMRILLREITPGVLQLMPKEKAKEVT